MNVAYSSFQLTSLSQLLCYSKLFPFSSYPKLFIYKYLTSKIFTLYLITSINLN